MSTEPNMNCADDIEKLIDAARDEPLIKQLAAGIVAREICDKAVDLLRKRIDSGELSDHMLLRIIDSLAKSTAYVAYAAVDCAPQAKRNGRAARSGHQSRRAPTARRPSNAVTDADAANNIRKSNRLHSIHTPGFASLIMASAGRGPNAVVASIGRANVLVISTSMK